MAAKKKARASAFDIHGETPLMVNVADPITYYLTTSPNTRKNFSNGALVKTLW